MAYEAALLPLALSDIDEICLYYAQFYPGTAQRFLDELERGFDALAENPFMYQVSDINKSYRRFIVRDYLVFYKINEEKTQVNVYRVLHGKRDIEKTLLS